MKFDAKVLEAAIIATLEGSDHNVTAGQLGALVCLTLRDTMSLKTTPTIAVASIRRAADRLAGERFIAKDIPLIAGGGEPRYHKIEPAPVYYDATITDVKDAIDESLETLPEDRRVEAAREILECHD